MQKDAFLFLCSIIFIMRYNQIIMQTIQAILHRIYDDVVPPSKWEPLLARYSEKWKQQARDTEQDIIHQSLNMLITYGDSLMSHSDAQEAPLSTLLQFLDEYTTGIISGVHILPYFPYTSDDGFSISDYRSVRADLGTWKDVENIGNRVVLMSDLVLNHCSSKSAWFQKFLQCEPPYDTFFITKNKNSDLSKVVRPRPHFVLSEYETAHGIKYVWTTFSRDQVDLNAANPLVLFELLDIMMDYVQQHKTHIIRLDAVAYLWKELGTSCIHHEKTHAVVKLMRAILDVFAPGTILITETNVPHEENISYFGNADEAQIVYQFPLPPLLLHAFLRENTEYFMKWAASIPQPKKNKTYFNFCASHDGVGVTPTHGILPPHELEELIKAVQQRGAQISYKATEQGEIPYEINVNYLSAITDPDFSAEKRAAIFLASQSILLALPGVPGIYIHSLLGSENWTDGITQTGANRTINREKLDIDTVKREIETPNSVRHHVFNGYLQLLSARKKSSAFHPYAPITVQPCAKGIIAFVRGDGTNTERVLCIVNVTGKTISQSFDVNLFAWKEGCTDLFTDDALFVPLEKDASGKPVAQITIDAHEVLWLREGLPQDMNM